MTSEAAERAKARAAALRGPAAVRLPRSENPVERALAQAAARRTALGEPTDMERILALPVVGDLQRDWTPTFRLDPTAPPLRPLQNQALSVAAMVVERPNMGEVVAAGVGHGKTLTTFLLPHVLRAFNPILVVPGALRGATFRAWAEWEPKYKVADLGIVTYNDLSDTDEGGGLLWDLVPDVLLFDEAHCLRHMQAARTKRVARYLQHHPATRVVLLSGTLERSSILDLTHLFAWALREGSPLPLDRGVQEVWAAVLDVRSEPDAAARAALRPLEKWAGTSNIREAFFQRMSTAPGVVTTKDSSFAGPLIMVPQVQVGLETSEGMQELFRVMDKVEHTWELPDGTAIVEASHKAQVMKELAAGFYYALDWPEGEPDLEWLDARRALDKAVRNELEYKSRVGYDSPALVLRAARQGRAPRNVQLALEDWDLVRDRPEPPRRTVWVTHDVVWAMADLARRYPAAILWYQSQAVGELLMEWGFEVHGAGSKAPTKPESWGWDASRWPACAIPVHGTGANLQAWNVNIMVESPSSGATWEQVLGRTHRLGQLRDEVYVHHLQHCEIYREMLRRSREDADFLADTTGQMQKLQLASWADPEDVPTTLQDTYAGMDDVWAREIGEEP